MAKKKVSQAHHDNAARAQEEPVKPRQEAPPSAMDAEKIESLKSLNQMLVKEAVERRQQVDSLLQSKGDLEAEVRRWKSEREGVETELGRMVEKAAALEVERVVLAVFVGVQVGVKGEEFNREIEGLKRESERKESEIARLSASLSEVEGLLGVEREVSERFRLERDDFEVKLKERIEEGEGLRGNLAEMDGKMKAIEGEIDSLRSAYDAVVREKKDMEIRFDSLMGEKESSDRGLMESKNLIEKMKEEINGIVREKESIRDEKNGEMVRRKELENVVSQLHEMVANLQQEEAKLKTVVVELEKNCVAGEEKLKEMRVEIDRLFEEKKMNERGLHALVDEKTSIEKDLDEAMKQLNEQKHSIEGLTNEKMALLEAKNSVDVELGELKNHVDELKAAVSGWEESNRADVEKIRRLESEVRDYKSKLAEVSVERDEVRKFLNEEKQNTLKLKKKIQELEAKIEEIEKGATEAKLELETQSETQRKEISSLQEAMVKARNECDTMKTKLDLADANSKSVLQLLKGTSAFCSKGDNQDHNLIVDGEELNGHAMEMEAIKKAFTNKAAKVEEMERKLECLQRSAVDAEKRKSFWAMLSSATTVLAAISLAYVARAH